MGRIMRQPNDIIIFGRVVALKYEPGRNDATATEIKDRWWKSNYPRYIRVYDAEFLPGTLENGISLNRLMDELLADSFWRTQCNTRFGKGNTDARKAYLRQPAVRLAPDGYSWLSERLEEAFSRHGKIPTEILRGLDWPEIPNVSS